MMKQQLAEKHNISTAEVTVIEGYSFEAEEPVTTHRGRQIQRGRSSSGEKK